MELQADKKTNNAKKGWEGGTAETEDLGIGGLIFSEIYIINLTLSLQNLNQCIEGLFPSKLNSIKGPIRLGREKGPIKKKLKQENPSTLGGQIKWVDMLTQSPRQALSSSLVALSRFH